MKILKDSNNNSITKEIGERIRLIRLSRNMTMEELSKKAGITYGTLVRIEKGENTNIYSLLSILREFQYIENLDLLIPDQSISPMQLIKNKQTKKRATKNNEKKNNNFVWEEDKK